MKKVFAPSYLMLIAELLETQEKLLRQPLPDDVKSQIEDRYRYFSKIQPEQLPESEAIKTGVWLLVEV